MQKDLVYEIFTRIHDTTCEIQFAKCGCVAGKSVSKEDNELDVSIKTRKKPKNSGNLQSRNPVELVGQILRDDMEAVQNLKSRLGSFAKKNP